ncbi:flagellar filament capping protein FliD [Yersinia pestis]|nr:flagellar filament capping protein FliD [Yersinia pestis]
MPMRIMGMASGMDIDSMIKQLMNAERIPYKKVIQKRDLVDFKMNAYREVNLKISSFRDSMQNFRLSSNIAVSKFSSSDDTKVKVTGSANQSSSHTIEVLELATNAIKSSTNSVSSIGLSGNSLPATTNVISRTNDSLNVSLNGVARTITLDAGSYTPSQLQSQLQSKIDLAFGPNRISASLNNGSIELSAVGTPGSLPPITVSEGNGGLASLGFNGRQSSKLDISVPISEIGNRFNNPLTIPSGTGTHSFKINGIEISYSSNDSVQSIMNKINQSAAGVKMSYDGVSDRFTITSKTTGAASQVKLENVSGNFLDAIGVDLQVATGKDANVKIDGVTSFRDSNNFTIDGMTYTLLDTTSTPVTVKADRDIDGIYEKIKGFVKEFNEVIELVNTKLTDKKVRGYDPLTSDEKKEMSDNDIKLWEDKVKSGLLHNDSILSNVATDMRGIITATIDGLPQEYNSLYKMGLTTGKFVKGGYNPKDTGKIVIDEEKLRKAIEQDPESVINAFTNFSVDDGSKGIAHRLYETMNDTVSSITKKAGRSGGGLLDVSTELGKQYSDLQKDVIRWEERLLKKENQYYKKFSAMEKALQSSNSQMSWLSQQFG